MGGIPNRSLCFKNGGVSKHKPLCSVYHPATSHEDFMDEGFELGFGAGI